MVFFTAYKKNSYIFKESYTDSNSCNSLIIVLLSASFNNC